MISTPGTTIPRRSTPISRSSRRAGGGGLGGGGGAGGGGGGGGVIGGIGAGFTPLGSIPRFLDLFDMDFFLLAMRYTLLEQEVLETEFPLCEKRGVGIIVGAGFNSGFPAPGSVPGAL